MVIDEILDITTPEEFDRAAMEVFRHQAARCAPYREYLELVGVAPGDVMRVEEIPFLPIELFKTHRVWCGDGEPELVCTSSATGGEGPSRHYIARLADYDQVFTQGFELFYGPARRWSIYALLPSYLEREGSSLVRMADGLIRQGLSAGRGGGFYLYDHERLLADMGADDGPKILLGVSYALLDLAEELTAAGRGLPPGVIVMETGGMKGRREEISKARMHETLREAFGVEEIHSEYGMAELMSQAYSTGGGGRGGERGSGMRGDGSGEVVFRTPPWMRVVVRDTTDPFAVRHPGRDESGEVSGEVSGGSNGSNGHGGVSSWVRGGVNIIDLANLHSCAFIQTQDMGRLFSNGSFTLDGRIARSDIRGCNLLIQ